MDQHKVLQYNAGAKNVNAKLEWLNRNLASIAQGSFSKGHGEARTAKMISGLKIKLYERWLEVMGKFSFQKRRLKEDKIAIYKYLKEAVFPFLLKKRDLC